MSAALSVIILTLNEALHLPALLRASSWPRAPFQREISGPYEPNHANRCFGC